MFTYNVDSGSPGYETWGSFVLVIFLMLWKIPDTNNLREEGFILPNGLRNVHSSQLRMSGRVELVTLWLPGLRDQAYRKGRGKAWDTLAPTFKSPIAVLMP